MIQLPLERLLGGQNPNELVELSPARCSSVQKGHSGAVVGHLTPLSRVSLEGLRLVDGNVQVKEIPLEAQHHLKVVEEEDLKKVRLLEQGG